MPVPRNCPSITCQNHRMPKTGWRVRYGTYYTTAHGRVQRYRCCHCGATASTQTESLHYFAKRRVPLAAVFRTLVGGAAHREIAGRYGVSTMAIQNAVLRLGRQAMAAQLVLLTHIRPRSAVTVDGLRSFLTSQDYPCDLTTVVENEGEMILSIVHTISVRGGRRSASVNRRLRRKLSVWRPMRGSTSTTISWLFSELWDYLRPTARCNAIIDTDYFPLYHALLLSDPVAVHLCAAGLLRHIRTPASAVRTIENRLFPVNYVDRLLRHRLKEHARETIAFARNATMQMHRAWLFAYDHNCRREHRVKRPADGVHAAKAAVPPPIIHELNRKFFTRRISPDGVRLPESIRKVWCGQLDTPPLRWRAGQRGSSVRIPAYARRQVAEAYQQAR